MKLYPSDVACRLANLPSGTLKDHRMRQLAFVPAVQGRGPKPSLWSESQVFGLCLMSHLRKQGVSLKASVATYHVLSSLSAEQLLARFEAGKKYLAIMGSTAVPRLVALDSITQNPVFTPSDAVAMGVPITLVDVHAAWHQFRGGIQDREVTARVQSTDETQREPA
jgi:hypothetical protein